MLELERLARQELQRVGEFEIPRASIADRSRTRRSPHGTFPKRQSRLHLSRHHFGSSKTRAAREKDLSRFRPIHTSSSNVAAVELQEGTSK